MLHLVRLRYCFGKALPTYQRSGWAQVRCFALTFAVLLVVPFLTATAQDSTAHSRRWKAITVSSTLLVASNALDAESLVQGMRHGFREGNPFWLGMLGEAPGNRARIYVVTAVPVAASIVLTAELERRHLWWWWVPNAVGTVVHAAVGIHNLQLLGKTSKPPVTFAFRFAI
jgi:hypothetical protein